VIDPLILVRGLHIAATALAAGTAMFLYLVAEPAFRDNRNALVVEAAAFHRQSRWIILGGLFVSIGSGVVWLLLLAADIYDVSIVEISLHGGAWSVLTETRFGLTWMVRLVLAMVLGGLMLWQTARFIQLVAAAALIGTLAFVGHAGAMPGPNGQALLAADILHLVAASGWVGALPALAVLLDRGRRRKSDAWGSVSTSAVRRFSTIGIVCVGTLLATGVVSSWNLLAGPRLWTIAVSEDRAFRLNGWRRGDQPAASHPSTAASGRNVGA
jgi:putative copper resistance protein D